MKNSELVIAGGVLTAPRAMKSYRESGGGQIALLSKENDLPDHRPALSKRHLRGETSPSTPRRTRSERKLVGGRSR